MTYVKSNIKDGKKIIRVGDIDLLTRFKLNGTVYYTISYPTFKTSPHHGTRDCINTVTNKCEQIRCLEEIKLIGST